MAGTASRLNRLRPLIRSLHECRSYPELRSKLIDGLGSVVPSRVWGMYRLDQDLEPTDIAPSHGVPDAFVLRYEEVGRKNDPMFAELVATHLPSHNLKTMTSEDWHRLPMYRHITSRLAGMEHCLEAPLLGNGLIIGTVNFGRGRHDPSYSDEDLSVISAFTHHVSTVFSRLPEAGQEIAGLTPRELEIARLVAGGLNNHEIAHCLSISSNTVKDALKRIFRKAEVDSRTELATCLAKAGLVR
jgi:DNA-binding CsgD family transcriptional regulator